MMQPEPLRIDFTGRRGALFWLALKTGFLTVVTLGFYRFWMKTRLRRWYWSAIRPGGHPMEYVGDPWEKLLGFFIAVVILTFYIGVVNLLLMFVSFSFFSNSFVGYLSSFVGVIPIWFYARYRARRYVLGRTRWRGVRFGLEPGAWGYAWRALVHWTITICTFGLLWPRMTFWLEKYRTDRTFFGSAKLHQGGRWVMLYRPALPLIAAILLSCGYGVWLYWLDPLVPFGIEGIETFFDDFALWLSGVAEVLKPSNPWRLWLFPVLVFLLIYGIVHYAYDSKRVLANFKSAHGIRFASKLRPLRVSGIYLLGYTLAYFVLVLGLSVLFVSAIAALGFEAFAGQVGGNFGWMENAPRWLSVAVLAVLYMSVFFLWGVLNNAFVTFPLMRHMAETLSLTEHGGLADISQRARDEFAEAEGFAEALDLGAAI